MRVFKVILTFLCMFPVSLCLAHTCSSEDVLTYWFGPLQKEDDYPQNQSKIWFGGGSEVDKEISNRFGHLVQNAANHELDSWKQTPRGRLALIILMDQFSRNIYRGKSQAFVYDSRVQELSLEGIALGDDLKLFPIERVFFYLPLEHAESQTLQELSVRKFQELVKSVPSSQIPIFQSFADYADRHHAIVERFGRFPHRNAVMNRESSPEEVEFLKGPNSSF